MEYKYCLRENFEDLACGRVLYHRAGMSNFPVRLSQEIFRRCLHHLEGGDKVTVYDPCCGSGYLLTVLGFLNRKEIDKIVGSDIDPESVGLAAKNLSLLTRMGLSERLRQLENLYVQYAKDSHKGAIESAKRLMSTLDDEYSPTTCLYKMDALNRNGFTGTIKADIVITDVPYGNLVSWQGEGEQAISCLLDNLLSVLKPGSVAAICSDKRQKIDAPGYKRLEKQNIGKRKFEIFMPI